MSELVYSYPTITKSPRVSTITVKNTVSTSSEHKLVLEDNILREEKPVEIIDDAIEINEELIQENEIYPVTYRNNRYYVRKNNNAIEIFQIEE
jgi:hypothetical protein